MNARQTKKNLKKKIDKLQSDSVIGWCNVNRDCTDEESEGE